MATADEYAKWIVDNQDKQGTKEFDIVAQAYQQAKLESSPVKEEQIGARVDREIKSIPRQLGLAGRYAVEGAADIADVFTRPIYDIANMSGANMMPPSQLSRYLLDKAGLPSPNTPTERVVGDASRLIAGGAVPIGIGAKLSKVPGVVGEVGKQIAARPGVQAATLAGAGLGGGTMRERGGGPLAQIAGSIGGGVAGGLAGMSASPLWGAIKRLPTTAKGAVVGVDIQQFDDQITKALGQQGIDFSGLDNGVKNYVREEVGKALRSGKSLNSAALKRLVDFKAIGVKPTLGQLTRDPVQYSKEKNLLGMSGAEPLQQRLNEQATGIYGALDDMATVKSTPYEAGQKIIDYLKGMDSAYRQRVVKPAYGRLADAAGSSAEVPMGPIADRLGKVIDDYGVENIPPAVMSRMKDYGLMGDKQVKSFTVKQAEQLKTLIDNNAGNTRQSMALTRELKGAIDDAYELIQDNSAVGLAREARSLASAGFKWQEMVPAAKDVVEGNAYPDDFVKKYVLNAKAKDISNLMASLGKAEREALKSQVIENFKSKAGMDVTGEVGNVAQQRLNNEITRLGKERLTALLGKDGYEQVSTIGRVAAYIGKFPAGDAVNTSKTAATLANLLGKSKAVPVFGPMISEPMQNAIKAQQARNALMLRSGLVQPMQREPLMLPPSLLLAPGLLGER